MCHSYIQCIEPTLLSELVEIESVNLFSLFHVCTRLDFVIRAAIYKPWKPRTSRACCLACIVGDECAGMNHN